MKFIATALAILTFGAAVVSTSAGSLRRNNRRHLMDKDMECVLYLKDTQLVNGTGVETWSCELTPEQAAASGGVEMVDIVGVTPEAIEAKGAVSGETIMKATSAHVEHVDDADHHVKTVLNVSDSEYGVEEMDWETDPRHTRNRKARRQRHRNLADSSPGTLKVLVVRTIDSNDIQMAANALQLKDDLFDDDVCIKTQYAACSHDQMIIEQATEFSTTIGDVEVDGIVDVKLTIPVSQGKTAIESAAFNKATSLYGGGSSLSSTFDLVMFCQPPGTGGWVAYAYINDWRSYYNDAWCQKVSAQMHEVGHNFGLAHSGVPGLSQYSDTSGMMGFSTNSDDGPKKCFNAAKSYQLGWYDEQIDSIDPLSFIGNPQTFVMNGVADYEKDGSSNAIVSLRLINSGTTQGGIDYYIGYNRKTGANDGTNGVPNMVTLTEKDRAYNVYGKSRRLAAMNVGQSTRIQNYGGKNLEVFVTVDKIYNNGKDANITISTSIPDPTEAPSSAPTQNCDEGSPFQLGIKIDFYGGETAWKITNSNNTVVQKSQNAYVKNTAYVFPSESSSYCLPDGCYTFLITDSYSDGLCCSYGQGYFRGYLDGDSTPIFEGGTFGASDTKEFCVDSSDAPAPTTPPVVAPTSPPTNPPTNPPTVPPTSPPTNPPTAPPTNPPTVPPTSPPTAPPTNPPTVPPTSPPTAPPTNPPTVPPTSPPTAPPTNPPTVPPTSPPTAPPTIPPTVPPTSLPTAPPTNPPTIPPTSGPAESPQQCVDDPLFRWKGVDKKDCDWIKKIPKKTINKCKRFEGGIKVYELCPEACATANMGPCTNLYAQV